MRNCNLWDNSRGTIIHINVFLAYLLVQELFFNKNHSLEFLSVGCNVALYFRCLSQYEYHSILPCLAVDNKEEETPCAESNIYSEINHTKIFYFIALPVFRKFSYRTYRNGLNQVPQS